MKTEFIFLDIQCFFEIDLSLVFFCRGEGGVGMNEGYLKKFESRNFDQGIVL